MTPAQPQRTAGRRRLLVTDVDSTLIREEVIELLAAHAGTRDEVAAITDAAMHGELDFAESLRARVATLRGLPAGVLTAVLSEVTLAPGAPRLVAAVRSCGWVVGVVSGGFVEVVAPLVAPLGVTHVRANRLEVDGGALTGRVLGEVVDRVAKARALVEFAEAEGIDPADTVAIGDGANDLDMLAAAGLGIAFAAKPVVCAQATVSLPGPRLDAALDILVERGWLPATALG